MKYETILHNNERSKIRKQLLGQRIRLSCDVHQDYSQRICAHLNQFFPQLSRMYVGFFWPIKNEPDLLSLMHEWSNQANQGFCALLPVIEGKNQPLKFRQWLPETVMGEDCYGIPYPLQGEYQIPQALLIPGVAFDLSGYRLGYGGGYYDRTLVSLTDNTLRIGVAYAFSEIETIYPQEHDIALDAWVTESGVIRIKK